MNHDTWKGIFLQKQGLLKPQSVQQICRKLQNEILISMILSCLTTRKMAT